MQHHLICMCGTCGRKRIGECTCGMAADMRDELANLVQNGADREAIIRTFVAKYGSQEVLGAPIDEGFNRLAWLLPYGAGLAGIVLVGGVALRWSRRRSSDADDMAAPVAATSALEDRLNDELRELD